MKDDATEWVMSLGSVTKQTRFHLLVECLWMAAKPVSSFVNVRNILHRIVVKIKGYHAC